MIHEDFKTEFLQPFLWKNLGEVLAPFSCMGKRLFIYKTDNEEYRAIDENRKRIWQIEQELRNCTDMKKKLSAHKEYAQICFLTAGGLDTFFEKTGALMTFHQDIDEYMDYLEREWKNTPGIMVLQNGKRNTFFQWLNQQLQQKDCVSFLWLRDKKEDLFFNCILLIKDGKIRLVTTSERYGMCSITYEECLEKIADEFELPIVTRNFTLEEWKEYVLTHEKEKPSVS